MPPGNTETPASYGYISWRDHTEFVNEILENAPEEWDDDVAAEAIAIDYVRHLEAEVKRLGGTLYPFTE